MTSGRTIAIWVSVSLGIILMIVLILNRLHRHAGIPLTVVGSVIKQNADTRKESPIADVEISTPPGLGVSNARSDFSGYFKIVLPVGIDPGESITLRFRHPDYQPVDLNAIVSDQLYVVPMIPIHGEVESELSEDETVLANVLVRYTTEITITEKIDRKSVE